MTTAVGIRIALRKALEVNIHMNIFIYFDAHKLSRKIWHVLRHCGYSVEWYDDL